VVLSSGLSSLELTQIRNTCAAALFLVFLLLFARSRLRSPRASLPFSSPSAWAAERPLSVRLPSILRKSGIVTPIPLARTPLKADAERPLSGRLPSVIVVRRVLLASPRGYCAGVERAVETVERALDHYGAPVYVRKQIVHNIHVVRDLEARGAIFVEEETEVPEGATVVYSAHGVAPSVFETSKQLDHNVIDAVCPLVTKVHVQARRYAEEGYTIVLIGHAGHEEVVGTMGEAPESTVLVQTVEEVKTLELPPSTKLAYVTQTTLSVGEMA
jgi:4-hydroxy-3-methylbut-2-enyl diphosphate reductase LytB-like protein